MINKILAALLSAVMAVGGFFTDQPMRSPLPSSYLAIFARREGGTKLYPKLEAAAFLSVGNFFGDSSVTFPRVYAPEDGIYTLDIYCFTADDRSFILDVNGAARQVPVQGVGNLTQRIAVRVPISLQKGGNILRFSCFRGSAPDLDKITISPGAAEELPPTCALPPDTEIFTQGSLSLILDRANGVYSVKAGGEDVLANACAAVLVDGKKVYVQEYDAHEIAASPDEILFTHRKEGQWTMRQSFQFHQEYLLTSMEIFDEETGGPVSTNWIAPMLAAGEGCLRGGDTLVRVPFDNDDYATFDPSPVNSVGTSYETTALVDTKTNAAVVLGSVTHDTWKTGINWRGWGGKLRSLEVFGGIANAMTRDTQPHGTVRGAVVRSPEIMLGVYDDWRGGLDAYGEANAAVAPPLPWDKPVPLGYNSWGAMQAQVSKDAMFAVSDYIKENFHDTWKTGDSEIYINFDSFWDNADAINSKEKAVEFVEYCRANGQKAGIYYTPFACWLRADQLEGRTLNDQYGNLYPLEECLLHDEQGNLLRPWVTALPYDVTHPAVRWRVYWDIKYFLDCGFEFLKLDFITHAAMEGVRYDKSVQTGLQAYNLAMGTIAQQIGDRMFINLAMSPIFPHQYAHSRRVACDTFYSIADTRYMLNSLSFGFWEQKLYALPDPDLAVVWGREGKAGENEARSRVTGCVIAGTTFLAGDNFPAPAGDAEQARARFEKLLCNADILDVARIGKIFRPAYFVSGPYRCAANVYVMEDNDEVYIAVFNLDGTQPAEIPLDLAALTGRQAAAYALKELWSGETQAVNGQFICALEAANAKLFRVAF